MSVNDSRYHIKQPLLWLKSLKLIEICSSMSLLNLWIILTVIDFVKSEKHTD